MDRYSESSDSDGYADGHTRLDSVLDFSYLLLDNQTLEKNIEHFGTGKKTKENNPDNMHTLLLCQNQLVSLPENISKFHSLRVVDISNNRIRNLPEILARLPLTTLIAKNNLLENETIPKSFDSWRSTLQRINLSGNNFSYFPNQLFELSFLKYIYLGGNHISEIPKEIHRLSRLQVLCMGGNKLTEVHENVGLLNDLKALILSNNDLESLPRSIAKLKNLQTLQLHKNRLRTLPTEIIALKCLSELSLRDNPLVVKFVSDMTHNPPSLLELSARTVKVNGIKYQEDDLPRSLIEYLKSAHHCVNPKCKGVFFDNRVEHIKFVDFCGKYRVPLLQYLCSSKCVINNSVVQDASCNDMMKKVLLG
uniref:Leucine-rich repeat-containing protein 58 n=1 Tax=Clastoptera arizonana TaxID=38151 RepID=A0A1B6DR41_9HEMI